MLEINDVVLNCIVLFCIALHCIALHCIALHCIALHCIALHCIALHCIVLYCIVLYCIVLYCIVIHCFIFFNSLRLIFVYIFKSHRKMSMSNPHSEYLVTLEDEKRKRLWQWTREKTHLKEELRHIKKTVTVKPTSDASNVKEQAPLNDGHGETNALRLRPPGLCLVPILHYRGLLTSFIILKCKEEPRLFDPRGKYLI